MTHDSTTDLRQQAAEGDEEAQWRLYEKVDLSQPWDHPRNKEAYESTPPAYHCRSAVCPLGHATYLAVVAPQGCFRSTEPRKLSEITDDPSSTLMVLEVDLEHAVHWMSPSDATEQLILNLDVDSPASSPRRCSSPVCSW